MYEAKRIGKLIQYWVLKIIMKLDIKLLLGLTFY